MFSYLYDQLSAYEESPDPLHYVTRFLDGLKPQVRLAVAIQKPCDLDTAYELALLHEELGEGQGSGTPVISHRKANALPLPLPPTHKPRVPEEKKQLPTEDKLSALKSFIHAKGLCFVCGDKWSREHQCKPSVQLKEHDCPHVLFW